MPDSGASGEEGPLNVPAVVGGVEPSPIELTDYFSVALSLAKTMRPYLLRSRERAGTSRGRAPCTVSLRDEQAGSPKRRIRVGRLRCAELGWRVRHLITTRNRVTDQHGGTKREKNI